MTANLSVLCFSSFSQSECEHECYHKLKLLLTNIQRVNIVQWWKSVQNQSVCSIITEEIPEASHKHLSPCVWPQTDRQHK